MMDNNSNEAEPPRRGSRYALRTTEELEMRFNRVLRLPGYDWYDYSDSDGDGGFSDNEPTATPSVLQNTDHVQGDKIFQFQSKKTRKGLFKKVKKVNELNEGKALQSAARKIRKRSIPSNQQDPYSDSGSEYNVSEDSSSESEASGNSELEEEATFKRGMRRNPINIGSGFKRSGKFRVTTPKSYNFQVGDHFWSNACQKFISSDCTLDKLETPRLSQNELQNVLKNVKLSESHQMAINQMHQQNCTMFAKWQYLLHENFNILLYGLGSKRKIMEEFQQQYLSNHPVIVVNGFFPSLCIKDVLNGIIVELLKLQRNPANVYECCEIIEKELGYLDTHLYLIIHNIDGSVLRNSKTQNVLARLACIDNIHLIASTEHINGPLMWDHSKINKFNYIWWDMTSFHPYMEETSFEASMMIKKCGEFALSSLRNVFLSLTKNSKGIYLLMVKHQLENSKNQLYQGLAFRDLYSSCREAFLVSSDLALRAQLTEFVDHKMVKMKRSGDGVENLVIPISNALLQEFLNENKE